MLTQRPDPDMIREWKRIYDTFHAQLKPDRKPGAQVDAYFRDHYPHEAITDPGFAAAVRGNILDNPHSAAKLPEGIAPEIRCYRCGSVLVGIDLVTGEIHVESDPVDLSVPIYDDLFVYRGLDAADLENYFLTAEYIRLKQDRMQKEEET